MAKLKEDADVTSEGGKDQPLAQGGTPEPMTARQYIITTPKNPDFDGRIMGVQFTAGRGVLNEALLDPRLNKTLPQIVQEFREMAGYEIRAA